MGRKREEGIFELLTQLPWWISVLAATLVYAFLTWVLPTLVGSGVILKGLAQGLQPNAWLFACLFLLPIPFSLLNSLGGEKSRRPSTSRRRQEGIFDMLATLPWWVSVVVAGIAYVFFKWVFPGLAGQSVFLKVMAQAFQGNAGLLACLFLIPASIAFFNASRRRKLLDSQTGIESIRAMSWQNFELLVGEAFRRQGYVVDEYGGSAPDGGVDLVLHKGGKTTVVQCKRWREVQVSVQPVRELFGVMHAAGADAAIFVSSGVYTADAMEFARGQPIRLIDGDELASMVSAIQEERQIEGRLAKALAPSQNTTQAAQTCPVCGNGMVRRVAKKGRNAGQPFWGCSQYPPCKGTRPMS
jgi:restriction system protein